MQFLQTMGMIMISLEGWTSQVQRWSRESDVAQINKMLSLSVALETSMLQIALHIISKRSGHGMVEIQRIFATLNMGYSNFLDCNYSSNLKASLSDIF